MLKHLTCISTGDRVKVEEDKGRQAKNASDSPKLLASASSSAGKNASNVSFDLKSYSGAALITLPTMESISITCRLFASNGKLLTHFEDELDLYPPQSAAESGGRIGSPTVVRKPITFQLPAETMSISPESLFKPDAVQQHRNNSYFGKHGSSCLRVTPTESAARSHDRSTVLSTTVAVRTEQQRQRRCVVASPSTLTSCTVECKDGPHVRFYGSIRDLNRELASDAIGGKWILAAGTTGSRRHRRRRDATPALSNGVSKSLQMACEMRKLHSRLSPMLVGSWSDCSAIGCIPSVPAAKSRPRLHKPRPPEIAGSGRACHMLHHYLGKEVAHDSE